ncbi:MAG TPA: cupin domain-containing protein [Chitinophagaceae bacterium]|nr:cupin domain-containing protein [Chitinophagaceae bacterium]
MSASIEPANIFNAAESIAYAEKSVVSKTIIKKTTGTVTIFSFDKGEGLSEHSAPHEALIQLLDGKAEIIIGGQSHHLESGQSIILPANIPHAVKATERFKMLLTMIKG